MRTFTLFAYASCCSLGLFGLHIAGCDPQNPNSSGTSTSSSSGTGGDAGAGGDDIRQPQGTSVIISVLDKNRGYRPFAWVTAENEAPKQTNDYGTILFENLTPGRFSARVEQSGYALASVAIELPEGAHGGIETRLIPHPARLTFDATADAKLDQGSVHVTIPANAVVEANGKPFAGVAEATIVPLNPDTDLEHVPAPLEGIDSKGASVGLEGVFMTEVSFWNGADRLQLAPGKQITIEIVLPDAIASKLMIGQSISAWWLDLDAGIWREEGAGKVQTSSAEPGKIAWTAQVARLAWWNASLPWNETHCFRVRVVDKEDQAIPNRDIAAASVEYHGMTISKVTDSGGQACLDIKKDGSTRIFDSKPNLAYKGIGLVYFQDVTGTGPASSCNAPEPACAEVEIVHQAGLDCTPGQSKPCWYPGPPATMDVGLCKAGRKWCTSGRWSIWGCAGEVLPRAEDCNAPGDEDCDGLEDEEGDNCVCEPGQTAVCYSGQAGTAGKGICTTGTRTCEQGFFGPCMGQVLSAAETCATPDIDDNCDGTADCHGFASWSKKFGDPGIARVWTTAVDKANNVVIAGDLYDAVDFGNGPLVGTDLGDAFVAKFDSSGNAIWSKTFPNDGSQKPHAADIDSGGNLLLLGSFTGMVDFGGGPLTTAMMMEMNYDMFLAKFNPDGSHVWSKHIDVPNAWFAHHVRTDSDGNIVLTGSFEGTVDFGGGPLVSTGIDAFVLKLDANGNHLWSRRFGGTDTVLSSALDVGSSGNIVISGYFGGTVDFGNGPLIDEDWTPQVATIDLFALMLDPSGNPLWSKSFDLYNPGYTRAVAIDAGGNVFIVGDFRTTVDFGGDLLISEGSHDVFIAKLDANGKHLWSHRLGGKSDDGASGVGVDAVGNVVVTGAFAATADFGGGPISSAGGMDVFAARLDSNGNHIWSRRFGDNNSQYSTAMAIDGGGYVFVTGYFAGAIDFGTGLLANDGGDDIFLAKLVP